MYTYYIMYSSFVTKQKHAHNVTHKQKLADAKFWPFVKIAFVLVCASSLIHGSY